jgi:valyl-tRNA synthetase
MEIPKTYDPATVEEKWYQYWLDHKFFAAKPNPDKEPYTVVIPPPNVTGVLHMGHMLNNTIQDVLVRKARMEGKVACWVPGTDHASIATEAKVVAMLKEKGIEKRHISREEFLKYAWEWKDKYGGIILGQLKKLGASCDWDRTRFTMEESLSEAVIEVFVDLYEKGQIYRGVRMVNWDPQGRTALSDEEVIHKEVNAKLYYIKYQIAGTDGQYLTIATTRPETIMADAAICVNPNDERYTQLHGKKALIPLINREIPIIQDEYVAMDFGTGCLKVTPAHDLNDYELGLKHKLPVIDILNDDGTLNEKAQIYVDMERFAVRKQIAIDLEAAGQLEKTEDYKSNVGYSERTNAVIEPKLSLQWFLRMQELAKPALDNVMNDTVQLQPARFKNMYRSWMENVQDWCISRQLWWGHRIPAYYLPNGEYVVAESAEKALEVARSAHNLSNLTLADLHQDEDVLDTWFSSWLWPISVFDGFKDPDNADINYFYPTNTLVTGFDIIFFWVARMIIAGYEFRGQKPFQTVYFTGMVRDKQGRKMSKQLGNSPDPLDLIARFGADGVRTGMLFSSPAGNDLLFDEKLCEQGSRFNNKIWNAYRLIKGWEVAPDTIDTQSLENSPNYTAICWFEARFNQCLAELEDHYSKFRMSDSLQTVYKLGWDDFCSWYLEMVKPEQGQPIAQSTYNATVSFFEKVLKVLHPFMPFITEELWQGVKERGEKESICVAAYPTVQAITTDADILDEAAIVFEAITQIRNIRSSKGLSPKISLPLFVRTENFQTYVKFAAVIQKLANISAVAQVQAKVDEATGFVIKNDEFYLTLPIILDVEKEQERIEKELEYYRGFRESVLKKLNNEKFVNGAAEKVVAGERQKLADAEAKIKALEESLKSLSR